jgi:hypothetical protein
MSGTQTPHSSPNLIPQPDLPTVANNPLFLPSPKMESVQFANDANEDPSDPTIDTVHDYSPFDE